MKKNYTFFLVGLFLLPAFLSAQTFFVAGEITRHNGDPVPDVNVSCDGTVMTDADGKFVFTNVPANFTCNLTPSGIFDVYEEVTVLDALIMREFILFPNNTFNPYQILACDVNNTQSITTLDIVKVYHLALGKVSNVSDQWMFADADYVFTPPNYSFPSFISLNVTDVITDANFIAIKRGDPAISSDYSPAPPSAPSPIFTISNEMFQAGDDVQFEVTIEDFSDIVGFQQTFKWDPDVLEFESASGNQDIGVEINDDEISSGLLPSLTTMNPMTLADGSVLLTLNFKALSDVSVPTTVLEFSDDGIIKQVVWQNPIDNELFIVGGEYMNGEGSTGIVNAPAGLETFEIFPNPIENELYVKALLQGAEDFEIRIVNLLGQNVYLEKFDQKELLLNISFSELPSGTYFLSLKTADGIRTEPFVKK